jgi:hypothetical protein
VATLATLRSPARRRLTGGRTAPGLQRALGPIELVTSARVGRLTTSDPAEARRLLDTNVDADVLVVDLGTNGPSVQRTCQRNQNAFAQNLACWKGPCRGVTI